MHCGLTFLQRSLSGAGLLLSLLTAVGAPGGEPKRVLLIHSFGREFEPFNTFSEYFRSELARESVEPLDVYDVALQSARFEEPSQEGPFVDYLLALFARRRLDLVVSIGGPAARFTQQYRERLFPGTSSLMAAVDQRHLQIATLNTNDSVVALRLDLPLLIEDILSVLPATTNIAIVMGNSALEKFWVEELRRELQPLTNRIGFTWLNQLSFDQIRARAATLPPRSAIFYGQMSVDASGIPHPEESALTELHAVASAPIFGVHDYQLGHGIVGGPLSPVRELGRQTALAAGRILRGESPGGIRPPPLGPGPRVYDWRELRRWGIREARLPPGSEVRLREMTFWQRHSWQIALVTSALVAQAAIILQLLANQARRRRAEQSLVETERRFGAVADAAPVLIWMSGLDKLCTFFNKPWLDFTGRTLEQEMGNGWTEGVHADDLPRCVKTYVEAFDARRPFAMEYRLRRHDGEFRWISDTGAPRHDARGGFIGLRSRSPRVPMRMSNHTVNCVLLADRHHGLTEGVRGLLETAFDAVVMVADVTSLFESAERLKPTVAVVDVSIARAEGLQWLSRLRSRCPDVKLIVLSVHDEPAVCGAALEAGADAFVLKRSIATDLLPAIDAVQAGQGYVSPGAAGSPPTTA